MKKYNIGIIKMNMEANSFPMGLILKRDLTIRECRYIMRKLLGIEISTTEDFDVKSDYKEYNDELLTDVNEWLKGNRDDARIMEYAFDCSEQIGIMKLIPIISYLKDKNIID